MRYLQVTSVDFCLTIKIVTILRFLETRNRGCSVHASYSRCVMSPALLKQFSLKTADAGCKSTRVFGLK